MNEKKAIKNVIWNDNRIKASEALKSADKPLTLDEINEKGGCNIASGSVQALTACGVWEIVGETTKSAEAKGHVNRYVFVDDSNIAENQEKEKAILKALKESTEPLTLREISDRVGVEVQSGTINTLVGHGRAKRVGKVEITRMRRRFVKLYRLNVAKYNEMRKKEA